MWLICLLICHVVSGTWLLCICKPGFICIPRTFSTWGCSHQTVLRVSPFDKLDMTQGWGQWPRVTRRTGWNQCALLFMLLEKSEYISWLTWIFCQYYLGSGTLHHTGGLPALTDLCTMIIKACYVNLSQLKKEEKRPVSNETTYALKTPCVLFLSTIP